MNEVTVVSVRAGRVLLHADAVDAHFAVRRAEIGRSLAEAERAYDAMARISYPGMFCRRDIGHRVLGVR